MTRAAQQNSTGGEGERRRQARATPKKRKGVCWGQPVLTTTDHIDSEDECQDVERFDVLCGAGLGAPQLPLHSHWSHRFTRSFNLL